MTTSDVPADRALRAQRAIRRVRGYAEYFQDSDWSDGDMNQLVEEIGSALDHVADALDALLGSVP